MQEQGRVSNRVITLKVNHMPSIITNYFYYNSVAIIILLSFNIIV